MIISLNWIKEYVNLDGIETQELVKRFGLSTAEVEGVEYRGKDIENVYTAKILTVENHPKSDHLHILTVDDGTGTPVQVVCGAPNVRVGLKTFFARVGANVRGNKIRAAKLAGTESFGMCCGGSELGIDCDTSGIVELDENTPVGVCINDILPVDDVLIEIDNKSLTNRPDLWGHYGIAREFATIFKRDLKPLDLDNLKQYENLKNLDIVVESKNCFRYTGITVDNISRKTSSLLMKLRLNYCGMRDINLLADLTNYVMLEVGQPMHAFDNAIVRGIRVLDADKTIPMETLEHETHDIEAGTVVICDEKRQPVAVAGIKGGLKSAITSNTKSLLIESACFDCSAIRKASRKIGLVTDASLRYEKSLDPKLCEIATRRALCLLKVLDENVKVTSNFTDVYNFHYPIQKINISKEFISRRGGVKLSTSEIVDILSRLGFEVKTSNEDFEVVVPSFRATKDISIKEDLVEEIFRMYGYDNIKSSTMEMSLQAVDKLATHEMEYQIKFALASVFNLNEVHSYVWNFSEFNEAVGIEQQSVVHLVDSSKSKQGGLRTCLTPTLLKFADENKNKFDEIGVFEIGRVFDELDENNLVVEKKKLSIVLASEKESEESIYYKLKQIVMYIAKNLAHVNVELSLQAKDKMFHPVNSCCISSENGLIGEMGILHPMISSKIDKNKNFAIFELDVNKLIDAPKSVNKIVPVSKFQNVLLDFNFVADQNMPYAVLDRAIADFKCGHIVEHSLKDVYVNQQTLPGKISYTISVNVIPKNKTLETKEIEKFSRRLIEAVGQLGIELRN